MPPPPPSAYGPSNQWGGYQPYGAATSYASFGSRLGAFLLDGLITGIPLAIVAGILFIVGATNCTSETDVFGRTTSDCSSGAAVWFVLGFAALVLGGLAIAFFYFIRPIGEGRQTVGMRMTKIRVVDADTGGPIGLGRSFVRYLIQTFISGQICYLGYLWMLWDDRNQTWHDKAGSSIVVSEG